MTTGCCGPRPDARLTFTGIKIACSWKCGARCAHCVVSAEPRLTARLDAERVLTCIRDAASLGLSQVEFTGGEALLFYTDVSKFVAEASRLGLSCSISTNAFWATTPEAAATWLAPLRDAGLRRIVASTDRWHQRFIPLDRVFNALEAAKRLGMAAAATLCVSAENPEVLETVARLRSCDISVQLQRIAPFGRARTLPRATLLRSPYDAAAAPCGATDFPTVGPDGRVTLCCAVPLIFPRPTARVSPLVLGWLESEPLATILLRAARDPLLQRLIDGGAAALVADAKRHGAALRAEPAGYYGACDLCVQLLASEQWVTRLRGLYPAPAIPNPPAGDRAPCEHPGGR